MKEEEGRQILRKTFTKHYINIFLCICLIVLGGISGYFWINTQNNDLPEPIEFLDAVNENQYSKIDVQLLTEEFATLERDRYIYETREPIDRFHFALDDKSIYVINLDKDEFKKFNEIVDYTYTSDENTKLPEKISIAGMPELMSEDLMKMTVQKYREVFENYEYSDEEVINIIGKYYLNTKTTPNTKQYVYLGISGILILAGIIVLIVRVVLLIISKLSLRKLEKQFKLENLYIQMDSSTSQYYKRQKLMLTKDYLINFYPKIDIIKYDDISWLYVQKNRRHLILHLSDSIVVYNESKKKYIIATTDCYGRKNKESFEEVLQELMKKAPKALIGFNQENKKAFRKLEEKTRV